MNFIVLIITAIVWILFDSILALIDYQFFLSYICGTIEGGYAFVGACILVAASNIAVIGMGIIGSKKKESPQAHKAQDQ